MPAMAVPWPLGSVVPAEPSRMRGAGHELAGEVGVAAVDAGVEDGDDRGAGGSTRAVDLVPADAWQRPLVVVARVVGGRPRRRGRGRGRRARRCRRRGGSATVSEPRATSTTCMRRTGMESTTSAPAAARTGGLRGGGGARGEGDDEGVGGRGGRRRRGRLGGRARRWARRVGSALGSARGLGGRLGGGLGGRLGGRLGVGSAVGSGVGLGGRFGGRLGRSRRRVGGGDGACGKPGDRAREPRDHRDDLTEHHEPVGRGSGS